MAKRKSFHIVLLLMLMSLMFAVPVPAASYRTVTGSKKRYGSYYVWRPENDTFHIQKAGSGKIIKLRRDVYTVSGATNGSLLYFTTLSEKFSGAVTLYRYNLKTGKQTRITGVKNALHMQGFRNNCIYGNGASQGRSNKKIYRVNIGSKKRTTVLKNYWLEKANDRYLYVVNLSGKKYRYDLVSKKLVPSNWKY